MWIVDYTGNAYNRELRRRLFVEHEYLNEFLENLYTVHESWYENGEYRVTKDLMYYSFTEKYEADMFIARLVMKLNTSWQKILTAATSTYAQKVLYDAETVRKGNVGSRDNYTYTPYTKSYKGATHVYVFDMGEQFVKIGISADVKSRKRQKESDSGIDIHRYSYTPKFPNGKELESKCHEYFQNYRRNHGEYFNVPYDEACAYLCSLIGGDLTEVIDN